jgi:hypothetical protein
MPGDDQASSASQRNDSPTGSGSGADTSMEASDPTSAAKPSKKPEGAPDMVWPAAGTTPIVRADDTPSTTGDERPDNPFAPRPGESTKKPRGLRRHLKTAAGDTVSGKRMAEKTKRTRKERQPLGRRNIAALTIAGISALCVIAVVVSYALWALNRDTEAAGSPAPKLSATPGPVLGGPQMLSEAMAKDIDPSRSWQQTFDQDGINDASPQIACVGPQAASQPNPFITHLRGLSASGEDRMAALHRADAYDTVEEAEKVFDFRSAEIGACTDTSLYIQNGMNVEGIGDEAVGVRLVLQDTNSEYHTVLLVRTGHVVNLLDVARTGEAADMEAAVKALSQAVNRQCGPAIGLCTAPVTSVTLGIPPAGGEQPGLLTSGDIPRVSPGQGDWRGNPPAKRIDIQDGTSCEAVDFASIGGTGVDRTQRTYLLRNDTAAPPAFGIDQVVLKMGSAQEATELVDRVSKNIAECGTRTLTSEVVKEAPLLTPGANDIQVKGNWYIVNQKVDENRTQKYRVGIVSAGEKVIYLRVNPSETFDFTDEAWIGVNLRAGERATQVQ